MHIQVRTHAHTGEDTCMFNCRHMHIQVQTHVHTSADTCHTQVQTHVHISVHTCNIQVQTQGLQAMAKKQNRTKTKKHAFKHGHKCTLQRNRCIYV